MYEEALRCATTYLNADHYNSGNRIFEIRNWRLQYAVFPDIECERKSFSNSSSHVARYGLAVCPCERAFDEYTRRGNDGRCATGFRTHYQFTRSRNHRGGGKQGSAVRLRICFI